MKTSFGCKLTIQTTQSVFCRIFGFNPWTHCKGYDLRSLHMVLAAPYSSAGARKYFQIISWGMKFWGKILMGFEIFGYNDWFPSTPQPGIINDHSLRKCSGGTHFLTLTDDQKHCCLSPYAVKVLFQFHIIFLIR